MVERRAGPDRREAVNHPAHYGGEDNPYEAIKVIEAWGLGFHDGNAVKYICRQGKKSDRLEDLKKARWYLDRLISNLERGAVSAPKQDRTGALGSNGLPESAPVVPSGSTTSSVARRSRSTKRTR